ncbi:hypothetical protein RvY_03104 [Ramazzottius varieornatus]|uniref:Uncharacterized protein n=1 Tax=Ramazzottius varieornatus TaxID=947166 RepID=A0A1D1ULX4_RAMVA|nr:hypothetical protein RvY_03104 [Ramazzottius varieornatus]
MNRRLSWTRELARDREESAEREATRRGMDGESDDLMDVDKASPAAASSTSSTPITSKKSFSADKVVRRAAVYKFWTDDCNYCTKKYRDSNSSTILNTHNLRTQTGFQLKEDSGSPKLSIKQKALIDEKMKRLLTARNHPFSLVDYAEFIEFTQSL